MFKKKYISLFSIILIIIGIVAAAIYYFLSDSGIVAKGKNETIIATSALITSIVSLISALSSIILAWRKEIKETREYRDRYYKKRGRKKKWSR